MLFLAWRVFKELCVFPQYGVWISWKGAFFLYTSIGTTGVEVSKKISLPLQALDLTCLKKAVKIKHHLLYYVCNLFLWLSGTLWT